MRPILSAAGTEFQLPHEICEITDRIFLGPFLTPARALYLRTLGVTHVLNVGEIPSLSGESHDGLTIVDAPIVDLAPIPGDRALGCVREIHEILESPTAKVYVHCVAGQNRSPTIIWLYLIASGVSRKVAKELIESHSRDSVPGHRSLVDDALATTIQEFGRLHGWTSQTSLGP